MAKLCTHIPRSRYSPAPALGSKAIAPVWRLWPGSVCLLVTSLPVTAWHFSSSFVGFSIDERGKFYIFRLKSSRKDNEMTNVADDEVLLAGVVIAAAPRLYAVKSENPVKIDPEFTSNGRASLL